MQTWRLCLTEVAFLPPAKAAAESMTRRPESLVCRLLAREGEPYRHISGYRLWLTASTRRRPEVYPTRG